MKNISTSLATAIILCLLAINARAETEGTTTSNDSSSSTPPANTEQTLKPLIISEIWARKSTSPNNNSAAYMTVQNPNDQQIIIIGASAIGAANNVELHKSFVDERGISRMTSIDSIVVPANSTIELAPGGIHIMLFDLKKSLKENDKVKLTLRIKGMPPINVKALVK